MCVSMLLRPVENCVMSVFGQLIIFIVNLTYDSQLNTLFQYWTVSAKKFR